MGSAMVLPGTVTTSPFGKYHDYEGTWDSTVMLWDGGYQSSGVVPADGATVTNLVRNQAAAISGLSLADCDLVAVNSTANGFAAAERTSKGGLHVASTQAGSSQNAASNVALRMSVNFANWLLSQTDAGADYAVMFTAWVRLTRANVGGTGAPQAFSWFANLSSATSNYLLYTQGGGAQAGAGGILTGNGQAVAAVGTPGVLAVASQGWAGSKPANMNSISQNAIANVGCGGAWGPLNYNKAASAAIYRAQVDLVDLSDIAGADRAAKAAAMLAAMNVLQARDFASGGRFNGDTYTAPATLKP